MYSNLIFRALQMWQNTHNTEFPEGYAHKTGTARATGMVQTQQLLVLLHSASQPSTMQPSQNHRAKNLSISLPCPYSECLSRLSQISVVVWILSFFFLNVSRKEKFPLKIIFTFEAHLYLLAHGLEKWNTVVKKTQSINKIFFKIK